MKYGPPSTTRFAIESTGNTLRILQDKDLTLDACFDFECIGLPHLRFQADEFSEAVAALAARFKDSSRDDFIFKPAYHKKNPADGFSSYAERLDDVGVNQGTIYKRRQHLENGDERQGH